MNQAASYEVSADLPDISAEAANKWTHAVGCFLSLLGASFLLRSAIATADGWRFWGCAIYAAALIGVYAASTLSHGVMHPLWRNRFRMLDQVCIFLLVVGSYTPFAAAYARDGWYGWMLLVMWTIALLGVIARIRSGDESVSIVWFLALGWIPILAVGRMLEVTGLSGTFLAISGGFAYTVGTWFLANDDKHPMYHAVWHCFTIIGSGLHFAYVYEYVASAPVGSV